MKRLTPLEAHIAGQTDRRAAYANRMREKGFVTVTVWCRPDAAERIRTIAQQSRGEQPDE